MRHLLVTNDFPPKVGGIQSYLWELWRRLPSDSFAVLTTPYRGAAEFDAGHVASAEALLERPQQRFADELEVLRHHPVPHVASAEADQERCDLLDLAEAVDGGREGRHGPARLQRDVIAEQRPRLGRDREDPLVEEHAGDLGDGQHVLERRLHQCDLPGGDAGAAGVGGT